MQAQFERSPGAHRRVSPMSMILDDVLSIEASFVMFVFSGRYKMLPELQGFPVDPTLLFFVLTFGLIVWGVFAGRLKPMAADMPNVLMLAFCAFGILGVFWSSFEPRNIDKAWRFILVGASSFFFVSIMAQDLVRRARLVRLMIGFSVLLMVYYIYYRWIAGIDEQVLYYTGRIQGNNYLEYAAHASILFLAGLALTVYGPGKWLLAAIGGTVLSLFALLAIGARGPMIFSMIGIPLIVAGLMLCRRRFARGIKRMLVLMTVMVALGWGGYVALISTKGADEAQAQLYTLQRLELQLSQENTSSLDSRSEARDLAFRRWLQRPLMGWGMGEFRIHHSLDYPHNLTLEILMELGLAGAVLFFPVVGFGIMACVRTARDPEAGWEEILIALLFLTEFLSHMTVQGYLAEDRIYFAYIALAISLRGVRARRPAASRQAAPLVPNMATGAGAR